MHPDVISDTPGTCPICGMKLIPAAPTAPSTWTCPMHPEVISDEPGTCPICGMKLIPADGECHAERRPSATTTTTATTLPTVWSGRT